MSVLAQLKKSRKQIDRYMADNERLLKKSEEWLRREGYELRIQRVKPQSRKNK